MFKGQWTKWLSVFLVLVLAGFVMAACTGDDEGLGDEGVIDEGVGDGTVGDFGVYDTNADAYIDTTEYNAFLADNNMGFTDADVGAFDQYDVNDDSLLDENEFNSLVGAGPLE